MASVYQPDIDNLKRNLSLPNLNFESDRGHLINFQLAKFYPPNAEKWRYLMVEATFKYMLRRCFRENKQMFRFHVYKRLIISTCL